MKQVFVYLLLFFMISSCTVLQQSVDDYLNEENLTTEEVASGLKEALIKGISEGSVKASKVNGYFGNPSIRIPFPPDVQKVEKRLRELGLGGEVDRFVKTLNRGAEEAAKEAKPIFVNAIRSMTVQDAWSILKGEEDAATQYLQNRTSAQLKAKFLPVIQKSLNQVNATRYYSDIISTYNRIPLVEDVNPDLDNYATDKALEGLFKLIAAEEKKIREDPVARTTALLKKVFEAQD